MTIDYKEVTRKFRANKSALTRARNRNDHVKVLEVCAQAFSDFADSGYPDDWALFARAADDATFALRRGDELTDEQAARVQRAMSTIDLLRM